MTSASTPKSVVRGAFSGAIAPLVVSVVRARANTRFMMTSAIFLSFLNFATSHTVNKFGTRDHTEVPGDPHPVQFNRATASVANETNPSDNDANDDAGSGFGVRCTSCIQRTLRLVGVWWVAQNK